MHENQIGGLFGYVGLSWSEPLIIVQVFISLIIKLTDTSFNKMETAFGALGFLINNIQETTMLIHDVVVTG